MSAAQWRCGERNATFRARSKGRRFTTRNRNRAPAGAADYFMNAL
jgi:hypothetical protein